MATGSATKNLVGDQSKRKRRAHRMLVNDRSRSEHATWKCSRLLTSCAIWERLDVASARFATLSLMYVLRRLSSDYAFASATDLSQQMRRQEPCSRGRLYHDGVAKHPPRTDKSSRRTLVSRACQRCIDIQIVQHSHPDNIDKNSATMANSVEHCSCRES